MNEIKLGIPFPYPADLMLGQIVGERLAARMIYGGGFVSIAEAKAIGLVDEVHPDDVLEQHALAKVEELAALQGSAFSATKAGFCESIKVQYDKNHQSKHECFLDCWFSEPTQELLRVAAKKL